MYQIRCDDYILYDPRQPDLKVLNPKCRLGVNTVGEGSFTIMETHPYYKKLMKLRSIFEIRQDGQPIFRGRMTNESRNFHNQLAVDLEGVLAVTNDTIVEPYNFPKDFPDATASENVVEYFLGWLLDQHNAQVEDWQKLKLGVVTVADPNNYITRESKNYSTTWETLKTKLFESSLGGYLLIRYEEDGNYVDYVADFELTNTQSITLGKNLLDLTSKSDATNTYTAILPIGAEVTVQIDGDTEYEGDYVDFTGSRTITKRITLEDLPNGDLAYGLVKRGKYIYSPEGISLYGWICVPPDESTWDDVTTASALQSKAQVYLTTKGLLLDDTITVKAVDLSFTDEEIQSFRIYRNVLVSSPLHGIRERFYRLTQLDIDILNPQNTIITLGDAVKSLIDLNRNNQTSQQNQTGSVKVDIQESKAQISELQQQVLNQNTQVINECNRIILAALDSYVETSNFAQYKETVSTQLQILADEITMNFTNVTEHITNVDGDLQSKFVQIYKYISFANGNITLGSNENAIMLSLENDVIVFKRNGHQFGWWDGIDFYTGNIVVEVNKRAQFGNFAFIPRSDGSLMFLKVGG